MFRPNGRVCFHTRCEAFRSVPVLAAARRSVSRYRPVFAPILVSNGPKRKDVARVVPVLVNACETRQDRTKGTSPGKSCQLGRGIWMVCCLSLAGAVSVSSRIVGQRYAAAWMPYNSAYRPFLAINSGWEPTSTSRAPSSTTIRSAMRTVEKRCDTRMVMRPPSVWLSPRRAAE